MNFPVMKVDWLIYRDLADNIWQAQMAGHPKLLTYNGKSSSTRRAAMRYEVGPTSGRVPIVRPEEFDRDEYPFACTAEGGHASFIGHVSRSKNRAAGRLMSSFFLQNNTQVGSKFFVWVSNHPMGRVTNSCNPQCLGCPGDCVLPERSPQVRYAIDHIPRSTAHNRRPGLSMQPKYLTIHGTANSSSTAKGERGWLINASNDRAASFHIVVDQTEAVECIPLNEVAWHAGDGPNGVGNRRSISIEICESGDRTKTLANAASVAARILKEQKLELASLRRHHDWSTKICPRILLDPNFRQSPNQTWDWFESQVGVLM
jgi:N-acetylmuramoyl-L-alanine amidase/Deoxyribonuclease NucA/NucB